MIVHCGVGDVTKTAMDVIVIPVNTQGVMGCGLALWAKLKFPFVFDSYKKLCQERHYDIGDLALYKVGVSKWVLLFPTKQSWALPSTPEYIEKGLIKFIEFVDANLIRSASFPAVGCGYGQLDFQKDVWPLLHRYLEPLQIPIEVITHAPKKKTT